MSKVSFVYDDKMLVVPSLDNLPAYIVEYTPDDKKYEPLYLKITGLSTYAVAPKILFTSKLLNGGKIVPTCFKTEDAAADVAIKLTLAGFSRRHVKGEYNVKTIGGSTTARFHLTKRVGELWAGMGVTFGALEYCEKPSVEEALKDYHRYEGVESSVSFNSFGNTEMPCKASLSLTNYVSASGMAQVVGSAETTLDLTMSEVYYFLYDVYFTQNSITRGALGGRSGKYGRSFPEVLQDSSHLLEMQVGEERRIFASGSYTPWERQGSLFGKTMKEIEEAPAIVFDVKRVV